MTTKHHAQTIGGMSYRELSRLSVDWYRKNGKYPERIRTDGDGVEYIVGDWSWERMNPDKPEYVDLTLTRNAGIGNGGHDAT